MSSQPVGNIYTVCLDCGKKYGKKDKGVMGVWLDTCDICGKVGVGCADAGHDFGIYNDEAHRLHDEATSI